MGVGFVEAEAAAGGEGEGFGEVLAGERANHNHRRLVSRGAGRRSAQRGKVHARGDIKPASSSRAATNNMAKKTKGPVFLRFVAPVLEVLKERGGSGTAGDVTDAVIKRLQVSTEEQAETTGNGQPRVRNQIGWARFTLPRMV